MAPTLTIIRIIQYLLMITLKSVPSNNTNLYKNTVLMFFIFASIYTKKNCETEKSETYVFDWYI